MLRHILTSGTAVAAVPTMEVFVARYRDTGGGSGSAAAALSPVDSAIGAGYAADRLAWAFAGAYQAALRVVLPALPRGAVAALCATERGGVGPRAMATRVTRVGGGGGNGGRGSYVVDGEKTFVTMGDHAQHLAIVCVDGDAAAAGAGGGDRPSLRLVLLDRARHSGAGVTLAPRPPIAFCPEVSHCVLRLEAVEVRAPRVAYSQPRARRPTPRTLAGRAAEQPAVHVHRRRVHRALHAPRVPARILICICRMGGPYGKCISAHARAVGNSARAQVPAESVLEGDAYTAVVKPFRSVEDVAVLAAALAFLLRLGRGAGWPAGVREELAAGVSAFRSLAALPPGDAATHVALAGQIAAAERSIAAIDAAGLWALVRRA